MDAYEWGRSAGRDPFTDDEDATRRFLELSNEDKHAFLRGRLDASPVSAPLPLPAILAFHAAGLVCMAEVWDRGARWHHYLAAAPVLLGIAQLKLMAKSRIGRARARAAGIEVRGDGPRVRRTIVPWGLVAIAMRLAGRPQRRRTPTEIIALQASMDLVEWWAWRPYLRRDRRVAPRA